MNYVLTKDFLFTSNTCTSIKFIESKKLTSYEDSNTRTMVVEYLKNSTYSDLKGYVNIEVRQDSKIEDYHYQMRQNTGTIINGVQYFVDTRYELITCTIVQKDYDNLILSEANTINIFINSLDRDEYFKLINSTPVIYAKVLNKDKFIVANFTDVNLKIPFNREFNNQHIPVFKEFSINESMVVSAFINTLRKEFPEYTIAPELNKRFIRDQKHKIVIYESKLAEHGTDFSIHVRRAPNLGRFCQVTNDITLEILSDDIETYIYIRDLLLVNKEFFQLTTFQLIDEYGREWHYTCDWSESDLASEIDRGPKSKYFDETILYSISIQVKIIGLIVEKFNVFPRIKRQIILLYTNTTEQRERFELEANVVNGKMGDLSVGLEVDFKDTELLYKLDNLIIKARVNPFDGSFIIINPFDAPYRGQIDKQTGKVEFHKRYASGKELPMEDGVIKLITKTPKYWETIYKVIAEIVDKDSYEKIKDHYKYHSQTPDGKLHICSISEKILDKIENEFDGLYRNNNVRIISSRNEVIGMDSNNYQVTSSGSSFYVEDYWNYDLFNYVENKFIRVKRKGV